MTPQPRHQSTRSAVARLARAALAGTAILLALLALAPSGTADAEPPASPRVQPAAPAPTAVPARLPGDSADAEDEDCDDGGGGGAFGPSVPSVECMTKKAVTTIFGVPKQRWVTERMVAWLLTAPAIGGARSPEIANALQVTQAIGFALLLGITTFAVIHFWAAGLSSHGGAAVLLDGVFRCAGAGLLILAWPFLIENAVNITNVVTDAVLPQHSITASLAGLTAAGAALGAIGGFRGALIAGIAVLVGFVLLFLGLLLMKIGLLAGLLVAFLGMPIAIALWPLPSLSAPASYAVRFVGMVFSVLVMWALCFRAFGTANAEFFKPGGGLGPLQTLLMPLIGIAQLAALLAVPRHAVAMWNIAAGGHRGMVAAAIGNAGSRKLGDAGEKGTAKGVEQLKQRFASGAGGGDGGGKGGGKSGGNGGAKGAAAAKGAGKGGGKGSAASVAAGLAPKAAAAKTNGNGNGAGAGKKGSGAKAQPNGRDGLPRPHSRAAAEQARQRAMNRRRSSPPGAADVRAAVQQIDGARGGSYREPLQLIGSDGGGATGSTGDGVVSGRLSAASTAASLDPTTRGAFQMIGAATPSVRRAGLAAADADDTPATPPARSATT